MRPRKTRANDDCLRLCLAYALNRPASKVPHFVKLYRGRWRWHLAQWLQKRRMALVEVKGEPLDFCRYGPVYIAGGPTRRTTKRRPWHHAIVKRHGETVYDPAEGLPLKRVTRSFFVFKMR